MGESSRFLRHNRNLLGCVLTPSSSGTDSCKTSRGA